MTGAELFWCEYSIKRKRAGTVVAQPSSSDEAEPGLLPKSS